MRRSGNRTYNRNTAADWKINSRHRRAFDKIAAGPLPLLSRYRALFIVRRYTSIPVPNRMSACSVFTPQYKSAIFHFRRNLRDIFEDAYFSAHESNRIGNFCRIYIILLFSFFSNLWKNGSFAAFCLEDSFNCNLERLE